MLAAVGGPRRPARRAPLEPEPYSGTLVDDTAEQRIIADREMVVFEPKGAGIDLAVLRERGKSPEGLPLDELERLAGLFRGEFLECIDLPDLHDFQAWCVAEREDVRRLQARILAAIAERTADRPETALPHVKRLVQIDPYNVPARVNLLTHLAALGRRAEVEQQFEAGIRQLREIGEEQTLATAWRSLQARRDAPLQSAPVAGKQATPVILTGGAPAGAAATPSLVGRKPELSLLSESMSATLSVGGVRVVLVVGEPGLGKTRLIEEAASIARERGFRIVRARTHEVDRTRPYGAWREAIGALALPVEGSPGENGSVHEAATRERFLAEASERILGGADGASPTLIAIDDVQWCDAASADFLHVLDGRRTPFAGDTRSAERRACRQPRRPSGPTRPPA